MTPLPTFRNLSADKQERITRIAMEEFGEKGYARTSINGIVSRLGIAKGSIFQYFGDKKGLFLFAFNTATEMVKNYLRTVRDETENEDLFTRLEATLLAGAIFLRKHPILYRLYIRAMFESDVPFRNEILQSLRTSSFKYLRKLIASARDRGELRPGIDPEKAAFMLDAIMDRFLQARMLPHLDAGLGIYECPEAEARIWIREMIDMLRTGFAA